MCRGGILTPRRRRRPRALPPRSRARRIPPPPPPPPPPPRRLARKTKEGIDLGDVVKYGGATALGAGAALLFAYRDKIASIFRDKKKEEISEDEIRKAVEEVLAESKERISDEEKEELVKKVLEKLSEE